MIYIGLVYVLYFILLPLNFDYSHASVTSHVVRGVGVGYCLQIVESVLLLDLCFENCCIFGRHECQ